MQVAQRRVRHAGAATPHALAPPPRVLHGVLAQQRQHGGQLQRQDLLRQPAQRRLHGRSRVEARQVGQVGVQHAGEGLVDVAHLRVHRQHARHEGTQRGLGGGVGVTEEASGVLVDEVHDEGEVVDQQQRGDGRQRRQRAHLQLEHARRLRALARHHCQHVAQILVLRLTIAVRPHEHVLRGETGVVHRRRARQHALDALQVERLRRTGRVSSDAGVAGITGIAGRASIGCAGNYA